MFLPSDKALRHLCDALFALQAPEKLLENYGLVEQDKYVEYDDDVPHHRKPQWEELKKDLDQAAGEKTEGLRNLCSDLLRRRNDEDWFHENPLDYCPQARFQDAAAQFEAELLAEGYKFDGFSILGTPVQSVVQRAEKDLSNMLQSGEFAHSEKVGKHLSDAIRVLGEDKYDDSLTQFRLALQQCLRAIACQIAEQLREQPPTFKEEWEVREYLEKKGFLTREERKGFDGVYGLLSAGAHGKGDKNLASLGYATCVMACHYAIKKFEHFRASQLQ